MLFSKRQKIILAISTLFIILIGYRIFILQWQLSEKKTIQIKELKQEEFKQQQATTIPDKGLSLKEEKELKKLKAKSLIFHGPTYVKQVALTFDDGPDNLSTPKILDILKRYHIVATFFVQGQQSKLYPNILNRIAEEGHTIGNHSYNHPPFTQLSAQGIDQQLKKTEEEIYKVIGKTTTLFRPPYGSTNKRVVSEVAKRGYKLIKWNIDTNDWQRRSARNILATIRQNIEPGSIILQHSIGEHITGTIEALPHIIEDLQKRGYQFVTVDKMLDLQPYR